MSKGAPTGRWRSQRRRRSRLRAASFARAGGPRGSGHRVGAASNGSRRAAALRTRIILWLPLLALAACAGSGPHPAAGPQPGSDPSLEPARVVAAFLDAANRRDHAAMASRFGTAAGPIGDRGGTVGCALRRAASWIGLGDPCLTAREVELRMDLVAAILAHRSYRIRGQAAVAGRSRPATRIEVELDTVTTPDVPVPFVLIQADDGAWLVEEVALERLTGCH